MRRCFFNQAALLIALHSSAHLWHSIAHFLQESLSCFSHSSAHARQASTHCCAVWASVLLIFLHSSAHMRQASAQAMQSFSHCSIPGIPFNSEAQDLHSSAHLWPASVQLLIFCLSLFCFFIDVILFQFPCRSLVWFFHQLCGCGTVWWYSI